MATSNASPPSVQREVLPIPDVRQPGLVTYDAKDPDTSFAPIEELRPPEGAPNVLLVLIDDAGFGQPSTFGGPIQAPNLTRMAEAGLPVQRDACDCAVLADAGGVVDRVQSPPGRVRFDR